MRKLMSLIAVACAIVMCGCKDSKSDGLVHRYGIAISRLAEPQELAIGGLKGFSMVLPPIDGFASNVTCIKQPACGMGMNEFMQVSENQYLNQGAKILTQRVVSNDEAVMEAVVNSAFGSGMLHYYHRVLKSGSNFYIVTSTVNEEIWSIVRGKMLDVINSARIE